ncbi:WD40 repeat-like protein, partial [Schizophyllum commune H4-8]
MKTWIKHPTPIVFSPDSKNLAIASADSLQIWDISACCCIAMKTHQQDDLDITCIAYSPGGAHVAYGTQSGTVWLWDLETDHSSQVGNTLEGRNQRIACVAFSPAGKTIASISGEALRIWDAETVRQVGEDMVGHPDGILCVAFSPDSRHVAAGEHDGLVRIWDVKTQRQLGDALQ